MRCPNCGADNSAGNRFCGGCGRALGRDCPACGAAIPAGNRFCGACGHEIAAAERGPDSRPPADASQATVPVAPAERRQLTVMFCDLVGSTALSERLDPEDLREVLRAFQEICAHVTERVEGHIAKYIGDGLLIYFGYPRAHEDDARRAVRAGLEIVEETKRLGARVAKGGEIALRVRVGIHTGLVVAGEMGAGGTREVDAIVGEAPNIAARIEALADPDSVVISDATYALVDGLFVCDALGPRALKGISEPVPVHRVRGESEAASRFEAAAARGLTPLVGREEEIGLLVKRWEQTKDGEGQVVLISGEAGVGKSRIARGLRERIADEPHSRVLYYGSAYHRNSAYFPVIDQIGRAMRFEREDGPRERRRKIESVLSEIGLAVHDHAPVLASLMSLPADAGDGLAQLGPDELKRRYIETLVAICAAMAAQAPVLMVVEDAHLMDPSTREYLELLIGALREQRIMLLVAHRPDFEARWADHVHATQVSLNRLSRRDSAELIRVLTAGKPLPRQVHKEILEKADGVPLFVEELTKTILESDLLEERRESFVYCGPLPPLTIPASLQDSLTARLDHLEPVKELAQMAATIGRSFRRDLLAAVSSLDGPELDRRLETLVEAEIIYRRGVAAEPTYEFKHALLRDAAYESLLKSTRRRFHHLIAEVLEAEFPHVVAAEPEIVAHHFTEAGLGENSVPYWLRAGRQATERSANMEAIAHLEAGLQIIEGWPESLERDRQEFAFRLAIGPPLMMTTGIVAPVVEETYARACALAPRVATPEDQFTAQWSHYYVFEIRGQWSVALKNTDEVLRLAADRNDPAMLLQANHAAWTAKAFHGDLVAGLTHAERGCEIYDEEAHRGHRFVYGGHDPCVCGRVVGGILLALLGRPDQGLWWAEEGQALAERIGHPTSRFTAMFFSAGLRLLRGEMREAWELANRTVTDAGEHGNLAFMKMATIVRGRSAAGLGEAERGIEEMTAVLASPRAKRRRSFLFTFYLGLLAEALLEAGRHDEASAALAEAFDAAKAQSEEFWEPELLRLRGRLLLAQSRENAAAAERSWRRAIDSARGKHAPWHELHATTDLARHMGEAGRRADGLALLAPVHDGFAEGLETPPLREARSVLESLR